MSYIWSKSLFFCFTLILTSKHFSNIITRCFSFYNFKTKVDDISLQSAIYVFDWMKRKLFYVKYLLMIFMTSKTQSIWDKKVLKIKTIWSWKLNNLVVFKKSEHFIIWLAKNIYRQFFCLFSEFIRNWTYVNTNFLNSFSQLKTMHCISEICSSICSYY